ncbi:MAG: U32 family peptidase [Paracoccaceae bacterium]|nr:U32 family peptidase [Paracoccaceae bacterium]
MELTLGPIAYHWSAERKRDFYTRIADAGPLGTVYLGEVICSKRAPFFEREMPETIALLESAGKTVVLSSLAEVVLRRERDATTGLAEMQDREIEINNASGLLARAGWPHRIGPFLNAYNEATIEWLAEQGATHVCLPTEMPSDAIAVATRTARGLGLGVEVQVFGRAPLAVSARCYHARAHGRTKDNCQFVCEQDPDGMPLATRENQPILRVNGIQTQSESYVELLDELPALQDMGVTHARLMPQDTDMRDVIDIFSACISGEIPANEARRKLSEVCRGTGFSNGFFHGTAGYRRIERAAEQFTL